MGLLQTNGYSMESIPANGEKVYLSNKTNIAEGGDSVDVTGKLSKEMKNLALDAVHKIPDLQIGTVEMLFDKKTETYYITEIKTQSSISGYLFPSVGVARDVAKEIIDYYFPETNVNHSKPYYYFGANKIFKLFNKNQIQSYTVPSAPADSAKTIRYDLMGFTNQIKFSRMLQTKILSLGLHGFIKYQENGKIMLVISGTNSSIDQFVVYLLLQAEDFKSQDFTKQESYWDSPIKVGFQVIKNKNKQSTERHLSQK